MGNGSTLCIQLLDLIEDCQAPLLPSYSCLLSLRRDLGRNENFWLCGMARLMLLFSQKGPFQIGMMSR